MIVLEWTIVLEWIGAGALPFECIGMEHSTGMHSGGDIAFDCIGMENSTGMHLDGGIAV